MEAPKKVTTWGPLTTMIGGLAVTVASVMAFSLGPLTPVQMAGMFGIMAGYTAYSVGWVILSRRRDRLDRQHVVSAILAGIREKGIDAGNQVLQSVTGSELLRTHSGRHGGPVVLVLKTVAGITVCSIYEEFTEGESWIDRTQYAWPEDEERTQRIVTLSGDYDDLLRELPSRFDFQGGISYRQLYRLRCWIEDFEPRAALSEVE